MTAPTAANAPPTFSSAGTQFWANASTFGRAYSTKALPAVAILSVIDGITAETALMASLAAGAKVCASRIFMSSIALPKMEIAPFSVSVTVAAIVLSAPSAL